MRGCMSGMMGDMKAVGMGAAVSAETFDEFLAGQGLLRDCEDRAIREIVADQVAETMKAFDRYRILPLKDDHHDS